MLELELRVRVLKMIVDLQENYPGKNQKSSLSPVLYVDFQTLGHRPL